MISQLYSLDESCPVSWTDSAESQLHHDYPFLNQENTDENYVIRRYLETLWLPESFNPLSHLISSLRRIVPSSGERSSQPHPLHSFLEPLLLSTRAASDKYRTELVQILADGGGAGEQEEMMMWYVWEYEEAGREEGGDIDEEKWRKTWLERLERRETMIQILLNILKLSLPGPKPVAAGESTKKQKKQKKQGKHELLPETDAERLESYMDKIAVWQLTESLEGSQPSSQGMGSSQGKAKADRHWTQAFCEDIVEPLFKAELPEQCELFRSKVFPESPFSDAEDSDVETLLDGRNSRAGSRAPPVSRGPLSRLPSVASTGSGLQRSRSRSLSVSLAQDEASQRASFVEQKRGLSREVSMSRVFKEKPKAYPKPKAPEPKPVRPKLKRDVGVTLVEETPVKRRRADSGFDGQNARSWGQQSQLHIQFAAAASSVPSPPPTSSSSPSNVCIEDTPLVTRKRQLEHQDTLSRLSPMAVDGPDYSAPVAVKASKARIKKTSTTSQASSRSLRPSQRSSLKNIADSKLDENADDSFMDSFGSSNVMLLSDADGMNTMVSPSPAARVRKGSGPGVNPRRVSMRMDDGGDIEMETPTKERTRKR